MNSYYSNLQNIFCNICYNPRPRNLINKTDLKECIICLDRKVDTIIIHGISSHSIVCSYCVVEINDCPLCRVPIEKFFKYR